MRYISLKRNKKEVKTKESTIKGNPLGTYVVLVTVPKIANAVLSSLCHIIMRMRIRRLLFS